MAGDGRNSSCLRHYDALSTKIDKWLTPNHIISIDQKDIKAVSKIKLLGTEIDDKLNFYQHIKQHL